MNWYQIVDMAEWPYWVQEVFKALYVLAVFGACWLLAWRRFLERHNPNYSNLACTLALLLILSGELASVGGRLWPYVFGRPSGWYTMRSFWGGVGWMSFAGLLTSLVGLFGRDRQRWWTLLLAAFFVWGNMMMYAGEPALVISKAQESQRGLSMFVVAHG